MPRKFSGSEWIDLDATGVGFGWRFGTIAFVMWHTTLDNNHILNVLNPIGGGFWSAINGTQKLEFQTGIGYGYRETSSVMCATGRYELIAFTRTTGTVYTRGHRFIFNTGNWLHEDCNIAAIATDEPTLFSPLVLGTYNDEANGQLKSEMWALAMWQGTPMTDSEVERLPAGNWPNKGPDVYMQFTDANEINPLTRTFGRHPIRQSAATGTTTRGLRPPPPGFRMSPLARRR